MATAVIAPERIAVLNTRPAVTGRYVLYWMQQSQRAEFNHALEYAVQRANAAGLPLLVGMGLTDEYPDANTRHYAFMLQGLADAQTALKRRGIRMVVQRGSPDDVALRLGKDAAMIITDRGYLRIQKQWRKRVALEARCEVTQVESDVIVPVDTVTNKAQYAARTIRPRILEKLGHFLVDLRATVVEHSSLNLRIESIDLADVDALLMTMKLDRSVAPVKRFTGGSTQARNELKRFIAQRLAGYARNRNQPQTDDVSYMSMYLHFGHISPVYIAMQIEAATGGGGENYAAFIEELVVRRELAQNYVAFTDNYDQYDALPRWARATLDAHADDPREHVYTRQQLDAAQTHDPYWNAAMREMRITGYMHNYMRMYWGKKIIEWSATPREAFATALALNNKYFIDGRDANSFTGVAWCFGLHDRPWGERDIFGTVRYMNAAGLKRKCDIDAYQRKVDAMEQGLPRAATRRGG